MSERRSQGEHRHPAVSDRIAVPGVVEPGVRRVVRLPCTLLNEIGQECLASRHVRLPFAGDDADRVPLPDRLYPLRVVTRGAGGEQLCSPRRTALRRAPPRDLRITREGLYK